MRNALFVSAYERLTDEREAFAKHGINIELLIPSDRGTWILANDTGDAR